MRYYSCVAATAPAAHVLPLLLQAMANSTDRGGSDGGAMFLGLWASSVTLYNSTFSRNNASGHGGAISSLAISSTISIVNSTASNNTAGEHFDQSLNLADLAGRRSVQSEGGAVHVQGSNPSLTVVGTNMTNNQAGRVRRPKTMLMCLGYA